MDNEKRFFLLSNDLIYTVSQLPHDKAGELFKHILEFVNDKNPFTQDALINMAFEPVKQDLIKDFEKKQAIKVMRSEAGRLSAGSRRSKPKAKTVKKTQHLLTHVNTCQHVLTNVELNYQEIVDTFNSTCLDLPKAMLTDERIKLIDIILKKFTLEQIEEVFEKASKSDFINGKVKKWKGNLNWLLNPSNFIKVLEGNYTNVSDPETEIGSRSQIGDAANLVNKYFNP